MGKSVYSLVLSDEVMKRVDAAAARKGQSRSNFVNQLLAGCLSYETPEMRMRDIFDSVESILSEHETLHFLSKAGGSVTMKSALSYRYKPTLKYAVEIYSATDKSPFLGELKVSSRSGSELLLGAFEDFFELWIILEKKYISHDITYDVGDGKLRRVFFKPDGEYSAAQLGKIITDYIGVFDSLINLYFSNLDNLQFTIRKLEDGFRKAFGGKPVI